MWWRRKSRLVNIPGEPPVVLQPGDVNAPEVWINTEYEGVKYKTFELTLIDPLPLVLGAEVRYRVTKITREIVEETK